ncbi:Protein FAM53B [Calypte anna]|uniref:Protein FAM53B n=1 Tax=Calypte anna TaxID=9244 RepID=A0A091HVV5_CALAN|nr:Protein FAM53B [Calypte anna]
MVMILTKTGQNKGADSVTCRTELVSFHTPKMSQGPTLFSCGVMGNSLGAASPLERQICGSKCLERNLLEGSRWPRDTATTCSVTNLIKDLSLSDPHGHPTAPPSKRQCRSLSFSDEMSACGTSWRPLGSRVWTPVEKRRCYSGGSVQRYSNGFAPMQRSSSFSLPARSNLFSSDHPALLSRPGCQPGKGKGGGGERADMQRSLSCSHDRFSSSSEYGPPSACSTPASTPELGRRAGGLSRSRSQPCVLNDKKVGVKRRRPEEVVQEQRPSLDLAKMTQPTSLEMFQAGLGAEWGEGSKQRRGEVASPLQPPSSFLKGAPACTPVPDPPGSRAQERQPGRDELSCEEEEEGGGKEEDGTAWRSGGTGTESLFQLDGEIDIEQIENN